MEEMFDLSTSPSLSFEIRTKKPMDLFVPFYLSFPVSVQVAAIPGMWNDDIHIHIHILVDIVPENWLAHKEISI